MFLMPQEDRSEALVLTDEPLRIRFAGSPDDDDDDDGMECYSCSCSVSEMNSLGGLNG